ncbi:hypothetical protein AK812_SmicGene31882 [Symbiodinium microadriaticum]|uniref:Uncharacterized protein n=1 Tax=Symbiodinium microadriaticum TaxID=2951 RepID=A0A1Q9CVN9_SYMMI|nr:hypothetical protein AK812_SmicGene31882 [Symbiodinium microadriaticum]
MGRGRKPTAKNQAWRDNRGDYDPRYWRGAWSPSLRGAAPWREEENDAGRTLAFPTFTSVALPKARARTTVLVEDDDTDGTMVPSVQNAVNQARRAEMKVMKLRKGLQTVKDKWALFEEQSKENYKRERLKFAREQQRQEKELSEALEHQEEARAAIRQAIDREHFPPAAEDPSFPPVEQIFDEWSKDDDSTFQQVLSRAFVGATRTPRRGTGAPARTPIPRPKPVVTPTPMEEDDELFTEVAPVDPYHEMTTPQAEQAAATGPPPPGLSPVGAGQHPKPPSGPRRGVKDMTKTAAPNEPLRGPGLQSKLEQKRSAMLPFGGAHPEPAPAAEATQSEEARPEGLAQVFIDDDHPLSCSTDAHRLAIQLPLRLTTIVTIRDTVANFVCVLFAEQVFRCSNRWKLYQDVHHCLIGARTVTEKVVLCDGDVITGSFLEESGVLREQAQDLFVLLDFRPLGMRPKAICVNQPKLHLPTIIADFGLLLPPTFCANVAGGVRRGDNVRFSGHTTLLFYAERQPDWAATSSSDVPDDDEPDNYVAMVDDVDVSDPVWDRSAAAGDAQVSGPAGCYDSSLPADHSWNHGIGREEGENIERSVDIASPLALPVSMSQNANSATLGTHSEVEHHSGILTVAASSGVMPNPSLEANEPDPTIYGAEVAAEDSRPVIALIYVPETLPELITVEVPTPTAVPSFLSAVVGARSDERARVFPEITPVAPQPVLEFALLVAAPEWLTEHVIVLFDCRRIEQGVFAARVSHSLNRESILLAAGLPADMAVNVHVHGLLHPLSRGQRITMVPGMTISIVPPSERVPVGYDLADRLLTVEGWNHEAELPGPTNFMGSYLRVLTDAWPLNFEVKPGRHAHFREDLAHALGAIEHRLSTIASKPKVLDVCSYGLWTSSLLAATEQLSRVPFPPARQPDRRIVLFLDLRLILRGITWQLIAPDSVSLQSIADMFHFYCPFAHKVVVRSASSDGPSDNAARVQVNGQVLEVEFVLDRTLLPEGHDPDTNDVPPPRDDDDHPVHEQPFASRVQHPTTSGRPGVQPSRSRSPRGPTSTAGTGQPQQAPAEKANHSLTLTCDVQPCSPFCPNHKGIQNVAYKPMDQDRWLTSVERAPSLLAESPMMAMFWRPKELLRLLSTIPPSGILVSDRSGTKLRAQLPLVAKLLSDPPPGNVSADSAVENARIATHQVGGHWPRPPFRGPNLLPAEHEESDLEDMLLLEASFCVLTPGYPFERLDVTIMIPQTIQEIAELLQTCRRASHQELFPELVEIRPQPTVGWGFFLAVPPWINDRCVVCFDLSQWDGRVFAETVPQQVDLWILLQLADIPRDAEIDVHVPDFQGPLPWGTDCEVYLGCCISFMPRHSPPVYSDLLRMLRSPDVWNRGLGVATMHLANGYCVVTATDFFLFRLLPGREMYYRQDIASVARLHHSRLRLVPAAQQPGDVAISGWNCRAVLAAVPSVLSTSWDPTPTARTTGILDARPLLLGWMPLHTHHDWLDLTSLADGLNQSAPEGWCVVFPAFPRHWTWIWFSEGQILIAAFAQQTNLAEVAGSSDWDNICTAKLREPSSANAGRKQGHSSHPWNDMADYVAKTASHKQVWPEPPKALCSALHACDLAWMAPEQDARTHHAIPILDGTLTWSPPGDNWQPVLPEHIVPTTGGTALQPESPSQSYRANVATVNIQSLRGKCKYIEEQLHARRVNVAFLQETKLEGGTVTSQHYLRLHSRTDTHWGVAIWIHRQFGLLTVDEEPLSVDENDISFLYEGPRLLVLLVTIGEIKIGLVSGHCPHISRSAERDAFLVSVAPLLRRLKRTHLMLGGIDLNGRIPVNYQGVSGDLEFGDADDTGWSFAAVLADSGMWVPSMYSQLHCGEAATYTHPSGQQHRIDYVLLGGQSIVEQARSEVDETFDNGSPQDDHALLLLSLQGYLEAHGQVKRLHRVRYDRDKLMTNEGRTLLREILSSFKHPGWEVSPDQHCRAVECHLRQALDAHFSVPKTSKKSSYIPESVWQQRDCKLCFKRRVRHRSRLWQDLYCRAFLQWKEAQDYGVMDLLGKQCRLYELAAAAVKFATSQIKRAISTAKNEFLHQVAGEGHQGAAKILQRVKQAGIGGTKTRPISRPLPLLLHPIDGSAITTRQQRDAVWMLHFGKQEQGSATPIRDFICEASSSCFQADVEWTAAMLPTYADVEQVIRDIPRNKAAGLDNLPGEVLKAVPAESARLLLPLFLKSMVLQHQPIQWRGGILYEAFKRSGLQSSVDNYRSLFVSSYLAKTYHRVVRNKTQVFCRDDFHPLHLGSKKCAPVTFASMFVLAHFRRSLAQRKSVAVLYLDTSAAYYRIVRELAVGDIRADDTVLRLFERFGLTGEDLRELMETVESGGMLAQAGAPDALRQVVKDIHMHTWFVSRFSDGSQVCSSLAGSRPGESWADLIYAYIYGRVLCKIHEYAVAEDLTFQVPLDAATGVFPPVNADETIAATDATWADDSAFPVVADAPDELMRKTQRLCTLVLSCVAELVKRGKQITHLAPGFGSRKRRQADSVDFTLSLPERRGCIPPPPEKPGWSREQQLAYRALCDGLLSITRDTTLEDAHAFIDALFNNPLYPTEIVSVLDCVDEEVRLLHESDPNDPWDSDTAHNLLSMLQTARLRCQGLQ